MHVNTRLHVIDRGSNHVSQTRVFIHESNEFPQSQEATNDMSGHTIPLYIATIVFILLLSLTK